MSEATKLDLSGRKCPKHGCWIQSHRLPADSTGYRGSLRYCPRCELEKKPELPQKSNLKIIKI